MVRNNHIITVNFMTPHSIIVECDNSWGRYVHVGHFVFFSNVSKEYDVTVDPFVRSLPCRRRRRSGAQKYKDEDRTNN